MVNMINKFLLGSKNINRSAVLWNALASTMNSFQTMVLLMIITRFGTMDDSSIFVMAYAVGNLMLNIGKFGVRQFQVTDVDEKYSFSTYVTSRKISVVFTVVISVLFIGYNLLTDQYTTQKSLVILLICASKLIEAYEDVYHGLMQQKGRLDVAAKILGVRLAVFVLGCGVAFVICKDLVLTVTINVVITLLLALYLNHTAMKGLHLESKRASGSVVKLLIECLPLCACMCLNMYIANAPKYIIDTVVTSEIQTCFNVVFMPVFIIALLANFIFQPYLKGLGESWNGEKSSGFVKKIMSLSVVVIATCLAVTFVGAFIGTDILGFIYNVDLGSYNNILIVFMLCGGIVALQNLFIMAITVVRYQKYMIYGYIITAVVFLSCGNYLIKEYGLFSLTLFFMAVMILLLLYCVLLLAVAIKKR